MGREYRIKLAILAAGAWGTDDAKPVGKDYPELDTKCREKLRQFRWKHYWVLKTETTSVVNSANRVKLSDKCAVELRDTGNGHLEAKIFDLRGGQSKFVSSVQHPIKALRDGEHLIIAGDAKDKWDDAWFVVVTAEK